MSMAATRPLGKGSRFDTLLIANRGEIACRIIRSARRLGIRCVAVYSEADANARHVRLADEAICIGPAAARESYLDSARLLDAARKTGAQAIHPGYGFLSENADFADACAAAGLIFVGPPAAAIRAMGSKSAAKTLMAAAGVPLTPGYHGDNQDAGFLNAQADAIGYPVLIKASAGGGGKGMRVVEASADFAAALASCRREAAAAFGDERVLIERYLLRPRHIEFQIFADSHGHCVHLFERDCSVQRRHQKVLEEAPAPGMTPERRRAMGEAAVAAARAVGYVGAGTIEFIAESDFASSGRFYFMEMNTRLQVEHPVTEMITGQDLVEWQLRVAAGEALPLAQEQLRIHGHAIEARIYAEDASRGFLPSTGRLLRLATPAESVNVRIDSGVEEGDEITPHYDPMIAKLIVWDGGASSDGARAGALARLRRALADWRVAGVTTNIDFLGRLVACPAFSQADLDTGLIERQRELIFTEAAAAPREALLIAAVGELLAENEAARRAARASGDPWSPWNARDGWRLNLGSARTLTFRDGERLVDVNVRYDASGTRETPAGTRSTHGTGSDAGAPASAQWQLSCQGEVSLVRAQRLAAEPGADAPAERFAVEIDGQRHVASVVAINEPGLARRIVFANGSTWPLLRHDPLHLVEAGGRGSSDGGLTAPMPGKIIALLAAVGQPLERGAPLLILEAMKMEHTITAPQAGVVRQFRYAVGEQVSDGAALVDFVASEQVPALGAH
ncbi:acetyl-CoA carboxylase biotin carboxylase subunit [Rhodocyclus gracilis]|nr:acetyl-CoA carboxylase biotin carboxylase subunit [Rhodocyclus gracilis]